LTSSCPGIAPDSWHLPKNAASQRCDAIIGRSESPLKTALGRRLRAVKGARQKTDLLATQGLAIDAEITALNWNKGQKKQQPNTQGSKQSRSSKEQKL
jgi:hypothetical protein